VGVKHALLIYKEKTGEIKELHRGNNGCATASEGNFTGWNGYQKSYDKTTTTWGKKIEMTCPDEWKNRKNGTKEKLLKGGKNERRRGVYQKCRNQNGPFSDSTADGYVATNQKAKGREEVRGP